MAFKILLVVALLISSPALRAQQAGAKQPPIANAETLYRQNCLTCHQADGSGVPNLTPPLIKTSFVNGDKTRLLSILLNGLEGVEVDGESYDNPMPPFQFLTDKELADVITYVRNHFGNKASAVKPEEVARARKAK